MVRISSFVTTLCAVAGTCLGVSVGSLERRTPAGDTMLQYAEDGVQYFGDWKWEWQPLTTGTCSRFHHTSSVGAGIQMQFKGSSLSILGSFSNHPRLNITLDGTSEIYPTATSTPGQPASVAYPCMSFWDKKNLKDGDHTVLVELLPPTDDASNTASGGEFYFNGFQVDAGIITPSSAAPPLATAQSSGSTSAIRPDMLIIGVVIAVVVFALGISFFVIVLIYRRRARRAALSEKIGVQIGPSNSGAPGYGEKGDAISETKSAKDWDTGSSRLSSASTLVPSSPFPAKSFKMIFGSK